MRYVLRLDIEVISEINYRWQVMSDRMKLDRLCTVIQYFVYEVFNALIEDAVCQQWHSGFTYSHMYDIIDIYAIEIDEESSEVMFNNLLYLGQDGHPVAQEMEHWFDAHAGNVESMAEVWPDLLSIFLPSVSDFKRIANMLINTVKSNRIHDIATVEIDTVNHRLIVRDNYTGVLEVFRRDIDAHSSGNT